MATKMKTWAKDQGAIRNILCPVKPAVVKVVMIGDDQQQCVPLFDSKSLTAIAHSLKSSLAQPTTGALSNTWATNHPAHLLALLWI